jgi:hypothetical protein
MGRLAQLLYSERALKDPSVWRRKKKTQKEKAVN